MIQLFKDKKYWREMAILLLFGVVINIACFCMPMVAHCETTELPYITSNNPYYNENEVASVLDAISQAYPNDDLQNVIVFLGSEYAWWDYNTYIPVKAYFVYNLSGFSYASSWGQKATQIVPNASNFNLYGDDYIDLTIDNFVGYTCKVQSIGDTYNGYSISKNTSSQTTRRFFSDYNNPIHIENSKFDFTYLQYYPVYCNNSFMTNDNRGDAIVFLTYGTTEPIIGEFTNLPPLEEILNNITGNYTPHTNDTPPTYDNTLTDGQNISNAINGHSTNMNNAINNFGQNIQSFFNKLYEKLTNVGNAISTNIHNGFATLMQNIKDFFAPKLDRIIELLTQLVNDDEQDVIETWENTQLYSDFDQISQTVENGFGVWQDTSEPDNYKIAFHVEQIPLLHCDTVQYIDLGLFSPVIPYIRSIMWALLVYSVFYTVIDSLANYLNGGDE